MNNLINLKINNRLIKVKSDLTLLQACLVNGISIPRFCYHERLSIAGNCRMCLVEVVKSLKPVASCALLVMENMEVYTDTLKVKKCRENILEFLLINHPLDCPICDQGGECDLQDQTLLFGNDKGRFYEFKRSVADKNFGPFIKGIMTRCIHCTRCIRFLTELGSSNDFGIFGRGNKSEVGTYVNKFLDTEVSGNIIDLCPVGALTSKPYAFSSRSWELKSFESIDIFDSLASSIRFDFKGNSVMRVLPSANYEVNEDWISDRVRFFYDALNNLTSFLILKQNKFGYSEVSLDFVLRKLLNRLRSGFLLYGFFDMVFDCNTIFFLKIFFNRYGSSFLYQKRVSYFFNKHILKYSNDFVNTDAFSISNLLSVKNIFLINVNLRLESAILNMILKSKFLDNIFSYGGLSQVSGSGIKNISNVFNQFYSFQRGKDRKYSKYLLEDTLILKKSGFNLDYLIKMISNTRLQLYSFVSDLNASYYSYMNISTINNQILFFSKNKTEESTVLLFGEDSLMFKKNPKSEVFFFRSTLEIKNFTAANYVIPILSPYGSSGSFINFYNKVVNISSLSFDFGAKTLISYFKILSKILKYDFFDKWNYVNFFYQKNQNYRTSLTRFYKFMVFEPHVINYYATAALLRTSKNLVHSKFLARKVFIMFGK